MWSAGCARLSGAELQSLLRTALRPCGCHCCDVVTAWAWCWARSHQLCLSQRAEVPSWGQKGVRKLCSPTAAPKTGLLLGYVHSHWILISHLLGFSRKCQSHPKHCRSGVMVSLQRDCLEALGRSHSYCKLKYSVLFEICNCTGVERSI